MRVGGRPTINEKICPVELDYPLSHNAQTLLWIGLKFVEPIEDNVPTNEEQQLRDLDIELQKEEAVDPDMRAEVYGPEDDNDIEDS